MSTRLVVAFAALAVCTFVLPSQAAKTCTWTGGGDDNNWSTPENWGGSDASACPAAGDTVILSNDGTKPIINNDISGLSLVSLKFSGSNPLSLTGNALKLSSTFTHEITSANLSTCGVALEFTASGTIQFVGQVEFTEEVSNPTSGMTVKCTTPNLNYNAYFREAFSAPNGNLALRGHKTSGFIHFCKSLTVKSMSGDAQNTSAAAGQVYLESAQTAFGTVTMNMNAIVCTVAQALDPDGVIWWNGSTTSGKSFVDLGGWDQTLNRTYREQAKGNREFKSSSPARLTLNATASGTVDCMFNGKMSLCFNPVGATTSLKVLDSVSTMSGDLIVSNGTFEVAGTASFKNVGTIEVADGASFVLSSTASLPLGEEKIVLRLAPTAHVTLPAEGSLRVAALYVNGERQDGGNYTPAKLPQLTDNGASIGVKDYEREPIACAWDGGAGDDISIFAAANWEGDVAPDLANGTAAATFATGGETAEVGSTVSMYSLAFDGASTEFALTGDGLVKLYGGSVAVASAHTAKIAVPLEIRKDHDFTVASGATIELSASIAAAEGFDHMIMKSGSSGSLVFRNAQIGCRFSLDNGKGPFSVVGGGETVFSRIFRVNGSDTFKPTLKDSSTLVFDGGFEWGAIWIELQNGSESNPGAWYFRNKPMKSSKSSKGYWYPFYLAGYQTVHLDAPDNQCELIMKGTSPRVICGCDYAFSNHVTTVSYSDNNNSDAILDLNGFDQECGTLYLAKKDSINQNGPQIRSALPARLSFKQASNQVNTRVAFNGQIDLEKRGTASLTFSRSYDATGTVAVVEGTLAFDANGSAPNVTNVTVSGGTFSLGRSGTLPKTATVVLSDDAAAVVNLADGIRQRCAALFVGGQKLEPGTYGSATSGAQHAGDPVAAHFTGNGILSVGGGGLVLLVR